MPATTPLPASAEPTAGADIGGPSVGSGKHSAGDEPAPASENGGGVGAGASSGGTPPASGTTTPTKGPQRKARAFLDLAPLTGFLTLRGRYPTSQKLTVKPVTEAQTSAGQASTANGSGAQTGEPGDDGEDEEDDRRTIRAGGTISGEEEDEPVEEGKGARAAANGDARHAPLPVPVVGREKVAGDHGARSPPMVAGS